MPTMPMIEPDHAIGPLYEAYAAAKEQFGGVINLFKATGSAPNVLHGFLALHRELTQGIELSMAEVERVAMLASALNACDYCVNVHMKVGQGTGLTRADLLDAMEGRADDAKTQALLDYSQEVVRNRGRVTPATLERARAAGYSDKALLEAIGVIGLFTLIQYVRHVTDPPQDFPVVTEFSVDRHAAVEEPLFRADPAAA